MLDLVQMEKRQRALADFGDFALRSGDLDAVLMQACRLVAEALGTGRGKVLEIEHESRTLFVRAGVGWDEGIVGRLRLGMAEHSSETYSIKLGEPVITNDLATEDRFDVPAFLKEAGVQALANVPIFLPGGKPFGLLQVDASEPRAFNDEDSQFLRTYATILGPVIDRLLKVQALNEGEASQSFLLRLSDALRAEPNASAMAERAIRMLSDQMGLDRCYITFYRPDEDEASFPYQVGNDTVPPLPAKVRLSDFPEAYEQVRHATFVVEDDFERRGLSDAERTSSEALGMRAMLASTIRRGKGNPLASLMATSSRPRHWTATEVALIEEAAERTWAAMESARAEAALRQSEERYRTLFESMDEGYLLGEVILDENGKAIDLVFLEANPAAVRLAGREFTGQSMREIEPHYEEHWYEAYGRVALTGESLRAEHYAEPHGRWFDFQLSRVGSPESRRVACIYQDVTERRRAEQALRESEEKYRTLFESIDEGFCVIEVLFDHAGRPIDYVFLETNAAFERQTGLVDAIGKRMRALAPDHEQHWFEIYGHIAMSGEPQRFERRAEALGRWYDVYAFRISVPEQRRVAILFNDVADRKQAESELRVSEERQAFLLKLSDALRPLADAEEIQTTTTRLLGEHLGVDRAMYAEVTGQPGAEAGVIRGQFIRPAAPGRPAPAAFPDHFTYETFGADVMARRYSGQGLAVADVNADAEFDATERAAWASVGVQAAIVAPLVKGDRLVAELGVHSETPRIWTDAEVSLVREVGERTWAAAERARAEAALRTSEQRYHSLFQSMDEAYAVVEVLKDEAGAWADFRFVEVNPAFMHHTGMSHPVGRTATELLGSPNPRWAQMYGQALDNGEPLRVQESELTLGRTFDLNIFSLEPALNRVAVLFTDITVRKLAEEALRASEERFRLLLQNVRDYAIFTTDGDGQITSWPSGAAAVYGWSEREILGRSVDLTFLPDDVAGDAPKEERETAAREGLAPNVRWHVRKDGTRIFIEGSTQPLVGADGEIREFIKIGQDVTKARRTQQALAEGEQRLRTLTEGIPQLVWRSGDGGRWTWSSPQWQAFTGQSLAQSLGLGWLDAVHPEDREAATLAWAKAPGTGVVDVEYRVHRASDDEYLWHHTRSLPVRNGSGGIMEWLGTTTDVQQLKELQERQAVMVAELQHRTRNLIAVVRSIAQQTMAQTGPTEAFRDEFSHRLEALARVQGLLSRSDEEPITIETLIRMELDALGAKPEAGRIEIQGPPARIRHSVVQTLALALHELATNARKYGALASDHGRLQVRWRTYTDAKDDRLALDWMETGGQPPKPDGDARRGYGRELIEHALPYSLNANTSFQHDEIGLRCTIDMPLKRTRGRRKAA